MNESDLIPLLTLHLKLDEGFSRTAYMDSVGKMTIGYGRNLEDVGINAAEALVLLGNDIEAAVREANRTWPWLTKKPVAVRLGFYNMVFNMGLARVKGFVRMLDRLEKDDYKGAAEEALNSKWAQQVGKRAERIAALFREATL